MYRHLLDLSLFGMNIILFHFHLLNTFLFDQLWTSHINKTIDLMRELYFLADEDIDLSAKTWYYALSLDLILDAGIVLESYETSYNYYKQFIGKDYSAVCIDNIDR